jgi:hypothetical protein
MDVYYTSYASIAWIRGTTGLKFLEGILCISFMSNGLPDYLEENLHELGHIYDHAMGYMLDETTVRYGHYIDVKGEARASAWALRISQEGKLDRSIYINALMEYIEAANRYKLEGYKKLPKNLIIYAERLLSKAEKELDELIKKGKVK